MACREPRASSPAGSRATLVREDSFDVPPIASPRTDQVERRLRTLDLNLGKLATCSPLRVKEVDEVPSPVRSRRRSISGDARSPPPLLAAEGAIGAINCQPMPIRSFRTRKRPPPLTQLDLDEERAPRREINDDATCATCGIGAGGGPCVVM
uniref:Uncharacterized protein n=1 Tax=Zooxanthella nutricula TaxID=1333877 RepID=A0A7S2QD87_9DINO